jgi:methyl-accepting chemotaxis protein
MQDIPGADSVPEAVAVRSAFHEALDRSDARHQTTIAELDEARETLAAYEQHALEVAATREALADQLEATVGAIAEQVAAASTELAATAATLSLSTENAVSEAGSASQTVARLDDASREIEDVLALIANVAAQTKLLALNATIEAARAGEAGRGFAVVASEVKSLADTTARSTESITTQVHSMLAVTSQSRAAMSSVELTVRDMAPMVDDLLVAVDGHAPDAGQASQGQGLAQMADVLRAEVGDFLAIMRAS